MEALINDHESENLDVVLIQEPSTTYYRTYVNHSAWRLYRPTIESDEVWVRSLIYVNRKLSISSHQQIRCQHPDITAIKIWTAESQILLFSVYIPCVPLFAPEALSAEPALTLKTPFLPLGGIIGDQRLSFSQATSTATTHCGAATTFDRASLKMRTT
jgi:hypothetical protein